MDTGQWIVLSLSGILLLWFVGGALYNRRRGEEVYWRILRSLPRKPDEVRWNGFLRSAARLSWKKPVGSLRNLEVFFALLPRENLPLWLFRRIQRKTDSLYLRADFAAPPRQEVEVGRREDRQFSAALSMNLQSPYETLPSEGAFLFARRGEKDAAALDALRSFVHQEERMLLRLSIRKKRPHLSLQRKLGGESREGFKEFFERLQSLQ
jgi:hypothetical protein